MSGKEHKEQTQPLSTLWKRRAEYSGWASEHVRTSALAGLAAAWLFAGGTKGDLDLLSEANTGLLLAAAIFAASLAADILHYYLGAHVFRRLAVAAEDDGSTGDDPVKVQRSTVRVPAFFYNAKVLLLFSGYLVLVVVFLDAL